MGMCIKYYEFEKQTSPFIMQQSSMMSALGGVLSLYLGISFATLFEIVEIFIDLLHNMINSIGGRPVGRKHHVM